MLLSILKIKFEMGGKREEKDTEKNLLSRL